MIRQSKLLTLVVLIQFLILAGQWLGRPELISTAEGQITDPGRDRIQMIDQLRSIDSKLDKLIEVLGSGNVQVKVVPADDAKGRGTAR